MKKLSAVLAGITGLGLVACGGGGGSSPTITGIDGTGVIPGPVGSGSIVSFGVVTGFGSVYVNGVRFDTSSSSFDIDGEAGSQDDLSIGDVVLVVGTLNSGSTSEGVASRISFDDAVEGPIEAGSIDLAAGTFVALGQTVLVTTDTLFDDSFANPSLAGLTDGMVVEVSGFAGSDGVIRATRIEPKLAGGLFETTGRVSGLDVSNSRFSLNGLEVDYSSATLEDFPGSGLVDNDLVEVKGQAYNTDGSLVATKVELKGNDLDDGDSDDDVEIEGLITRFANSTDFDVSGVPVSTTSSTVFEDGLASDLGLNIKVEVEGNFSNGVLVADKVEVRRASDIRLSATIDSVNAGSNSFVVLGIEVTVDASTLVEDKRDRLEPFGVSNLAAGDYVEVRGVELAAGSGELIASQVRRDDFDTELELRGALESVASPDMSILGVSITTNAATVYQNVQERVITADEFYALVGAGTVVDVEGVSAGPGAILAREVEIEN